AGALVACLGVAEVGPDGQARCATERCAPQVTHWPLRPGDVVLLCSDGLIEEGIFLAPAEAAAVVAKGTGSSAQALAEGLAAAAGGARGRGWAAQARAEARAAGGDARQRLPTPEEPEGSGDNITCVVIRVTGWAEG